MTERELPAGPVIAAIAALSGFAIALVAGLAAGNGGATVIGRALVAMLICFIVGRILGTIGAVAVRDHIAKYQAANPVPDMETEPEVIEVGAEDEADMVGDVEESEAQASPPAQEQKAA
ncbi:MAG: hypothetical protein AAGB51_00290 [Planctomycetota bacterium]